jgi:superfamily II RNA helicase
MVKICDVNNYPSENEEKYKEHFEKYPYELSIFQKHAIEGIIEGKHILITAHTGTGKTLAGEFAIEHFVAKGKKVIYTAPIKTLINQKFYDFSKKYEHISFGVITGDIKSNPEADVLIVTAEILLNKLYQKNNISKNTNSSTNFEMDFDNDLACVVMDEVHYVNEKERGEVWEKTIMMLPQHVQLVMLSATIDKPENFAKWCENIHAIPRQVYLTNTTHRIVPLTHYSFITATQGIFKSIKDKAVHEEIRSIIDKPLVIQDAGGGFNELNYRNVSKMLKLFSDNDVRIKRQHVLNKVAEHLVEKELLPSLCFVLSRKQLEICANEVTTNLLEFDSKVPYIIDYECEQIIRKLPNYKEYLFLPEYTNMVALLRKGIAIHHSGIMPVLKEMVELLYAKGYIKLLFATETFSVGVNMPTKCVLFTDINKFDGNTNRVLYAHEYVQMVGRAGRRGIDIIGNVIHLNNLFRPVESINYKKMMNGQPQTLVSKFKFSFNFLLNMIEIGDNDFTKFAKRSMIQDDLTSKVNGLTQTLVKLEAEKDAIQINLGNLRTPKEIVDEYIDNQAKKQFAANKRQKELDKRQKTILDSYKYVEGDKATVLKLMAKETEIEDTKGSIDNTNKYIGANIQKILNFLESEEFIVKDEDEDDKSSNYVLFKKGEIASQLRETHSLVFANLIESNQLEHLSSRELAALFSCVTNISVSDDYKDIIPYSENTTVNMIAVKVYSGYDYYETKETEMCINTGMDYNLHFDILDYVLQWTDCECIEDCKIILQKMEYEKGIFLGEFVKAILKINNVAAEMEKVAEMTGNVAFLSKLKEIPGLTLKFVVTNQSLYI